MSLHKYIISGGGTGGHIFPAIAIAKALQKLDPTCEILFVGAKGRMEMEKVPAAGFKIEGLWISGLQRKLTLKNLSFPFKVISSLLKASKIISEFKPNAVIGVGGYASGPLLRVATSRNIPTLIQEQNSFPGITNRILAGKVSKICVAYSGMEKWFPKDKIIMTGNPVRQEVLSLDGKRERGIEHFGLDTNKPTLLIIGGSLGALTINESIAKGAEILNQSGIQVVWQTGKAFEQKAKALVAENNFQNIKVQAFIARMDLAYSVADLVISRAGAMSVSELSVVKKPCILVPSPNVAEDHQTKNAMALVVNNAAILVRDGDARNDLVNTALSTIKNQESLDKLINNIARMAFNNSADAIASEVIRLAQN
jgi:UDP-N-acetylglucosamine--N-acetylmuramyl-(pentapeptide) pyrophosphoryl-undecaprenol N-acetylglucosamine transferase